MPTDLPRFESNERVDLVDFEYMADEAVQALIRQPNEEFFTDPDGAVSRSWILDGFPMSDLGAGQLKVVKGKAILAQREGATIHYGALTTEGDASKTLDLSGYGNATYNIYIRFQYVDAETQSRMFWNPPGSGTEFAQTIQTRRQANWSLRVELASPGNEWVQIGTVEIAAGVIGGAGIVDQRNFYFEGSVSGTYANTWGGGTDRNADRQQYGIKDLQTFTAAVRTLFEDLRPTGGRWWEARGLKATGKAASNEPGFDGLGDGSGPGLKGIGGATNDSSGVFADGANSAATNSRGVTATGKGTGYGVKGTGGATGRGVEGVGTAGHGVWAESDTTSPERAALHVVPQDADANTKVMGDYQVNTVSGMPSIRKNGSEYARLLGKVYSKIVDEELDASGDYVAYTIPADTLRVGSVIRVRMGFYVTAHAGGGNVSFDFDINGGTQFGTTVRAAATGEMAHIDAVGTVQVIGAGGQITWTGIAVFGPAAGDADVVCSSFVDMSPTNAPIVLTGDVTFTLANDKAEMETFVVDISD